MPRFKEGIFGSYVDYQDVVNAEKYFYWWDSFTSSSKSSLQEFRSYNYSSSFYRTAKNKNGYDVLYTAYAPVTIVVKYKKNYKKAYRLFSETTLIDELKDDNTIFLPHRETLYGNSCLSPGGYNTFSQCFRT